MKRPVIIVAAWAALLVALVGLLWVTQWRDGWKASVDGSNQSLVASVHRTDAGEQRGTRYYVLLEAGSAGAAPNLGPAALSIAQTLGEERIVLAPPDNAVADWLDQHGLYLVPSSEHEALKARLDDVSLSKTVAALKAELSSPLFAVSGQQPRRDPLGLRASMVERIGTLGFAEDDTPGAPTPTGMGDLLSSDGRALLIGISSERPPQVIRESLTSALGELPLTATLIGGSLDQDNVSSTLAHELPRCLAALLAGMTLVLAVSLRRVRPVLCIATVAAASGVVFWLAAPAIDLHTGPVILLGIAFGIDGAFRLHPISKRRWASAAVLTVALLPLVFTPYPGYRDLVWRWALAMAATTAMMRIVVPALLEVLRAPLEWNTRPFVLAPMPVVALFVSVGATVAGALVTEQLRYESPVAQVVREDTQEAASVRVREAFFDPARVVVSNSSGESQLDALEQSARDAEVLSLLVPEYASRVASPGGFVIPDDELGRRQHSLAELGLTTRMQELHDTLETAGLRPAAFAEFLRGATDIDTQPSAVEALQGPLAPWIRQSIHERDGTFSVEARVHLRDGELPPSLTGADDEPVNLYGPEMFVRQDRAAFLDRLAMVLLLGLWTSAVLVWLGTRSLATALGVAMGAFAAQSATLALMHALGQGIGAYALPGLLLVGAAATVAGGRASQAIERQQRVLASGWMLTGACHALAGLALFASAHPLWRQTGLVVAVGAALASGIGIFVTPGLVAFLNRIVDIWRRRGEDVGGEEDATDDDR